MHPIGNRQIQIPTVRLSPHPSRRGIRRLVHELPSGANDILPHPISRNTALAMGRTTARPARVAGDRAVQNARHVGHDGEYGDDAAVEYRGGVPEVGSRRGGNVIGPGGAEIVRKYRERCSSAIGLRTQVVPGSLLCIAGEGDIHHGRSEPQFLGGFDCWDAG